MPPSKELEKETAKIDFAADLLSKSSLLEVEKDSEKETFAARDSLNKRHLLDMDIDLEMEETIVVQANSLSSSDWDPAPVDMKSNVDSSRVESVVDVEEVRRTLYLGSTKGPNVEKGLLSVCDVR